MTNRLRFVLTHKAHPYPEDAISAAEAWGIFTISVNNELLLKTEWNLEEFIGWYLETEDRRFSTSLPDVRPSESLAQASARGLQALQAVPHNQEAERLSTIQYDFRAAHELYFAFRGSYMPDIIIGIKDGQGEISFCPFDAKKEGHFRELSWLKSDSWDYPFDIPDFKAHMEQHLKDYLHECLTRTNNPYAIVAAQRLLAQF